MLKKGMRNVISVLSVLALLAGCGGGGGGGGGPSYSSVTLAWDEPTTNEDGTPLTDLAGYNVYYGTSSNTYTHIEDAGTATIYNVTGLTVGTTYYFAVTAYDFSGNHSDFSSPPLKVDVR
jgi:fibronectin type 3 domain-containing protein